jgi:hypothetical protein
MVWGLYVFLVGRKILMKGVAVAIQKTPIVLNNVYLDPEVKDIASKNGSQRRVTGKLVMLDAASVPQWTVLFTTWDSCDEVLEIAKDPSKRYSVSGYLRSRTDDNGKWYTNFIIEKPAKSDE